MSLFLIVHRGPQGFSLKRDSEPPLTPSNPPTPPQRPYPLWLFSLNKQPSLVGVVVCSLLRPGPSLRAKLRSDMDV